MQQEFIWVRLKLSITCFSLWTNYYFIIESIDAFYFVNNAVVYKALLVKKKRWQCCLQNIYCKCCIYTFASNLIILTFSKAVDHNLLAWLMDWAIVGGTEVEKKPRDEGGRFESEDTMVQNYIFPNRKHFLLNLLKSSWNLRKWNIWFIMLSLKCDQPCVNFPTYFQQWNLNWDTPFHNSSIDTKIGTFES